MPANAAACFHTSALHPAQYSWPGKHEKGLCLFPGLRFPGVLRPLFQADQHLRTFFKTSLTIFPCCGIVIKSTTWARSSAGRAFGSHPRGRGFDPLRVHHFKTPHRIVRCGVLMSKSFETLCRISLPKIRCKPVNGTNNIVDEIVRYMIFYLQKCFIAI